MAPCLVLVLFFDGGVLRYVTVHHKQICCSCEDEFVICIQFNVDLSVLANRNDGFVIITLTVTVLVINWFVTCIRRCTKCELSPFYLNELVIVAALT